MSETPRALHCGGAACGTPTENPYHGPGTVLDAYCSYRDRADKERAQSRVGAVGVPGRRDLCGQQPLEGASGRKRNSQYP